MKKTTSTPSPTYERVQRSLAVNREAKLTFPALFMGLTGRQIGDDAVVLEFDDDPMFRDANGELSWSVLGVLADAGVSSVTRMKAGASVRPATVHLQVQMTGASTQGPIVTHGRFLTFSERGRVRQSFVTATIKSGETLVGHVSAAFMLLDLPKGETQPPRAWLPEGFEPSPLDAITFDPSEREALKSCRRAEAAASEAFPFIEHFWCGIPKAGKGKARLNLRVTPHLSNRAGHVHGGLLLGTAACVANAALPGDMRLSNICAWFVSPGLGPRLKVRSSVVQQGRHFAVVHTQILAASGKLVLEATSQHTAAAS